MNYLTHAPQNLYFLLLGLTHSVQSRGSIVSLFFLGFVIFLSFLYYCVVMGAIPQKWLFACGDCGCIFTTMAEKQTGLCQYAKAVK